METSKLVIQIMGIVARQPWLSSKLREQANQVVVSILDDDAISKGRTCISSLCDELEIDRISSHRQLGLISNWESKLPIVGTYLSGVNRIRWNKAQQAQLSASITRVWLRVAPPERLVYSLLCLQANEKARELSLKLIEEQPKDAAGYGLLGIASAQLENYGDALNCITKALGIKSAGREGLHPALLYRLHRGMANIAPNQARAAHLICAELCRKRSLRSYEEVLNQTAGIPEVLGDDFG